MNSLGLQTGLNFGTALPPPSPMVGAAIRPLYMLNGGAGCSGSEFSSPFWSPDPKTAFSCGSCAFGVDANKALKYSRSAGYSSCGGNVAQARVCGQNPCSLPTRSLDDAFEEISVDSTMNALYGSDFPDGGVTLQSTKGSFGYSLRAAPAANPHNQVFPLYQGTFGSGALVYSARNIVGP